MKLNKHSLTAFIILLLIPLAASADITIGAGSAEIFNNNEKEARSQAINNALSDIVKKEVALLLDPGTIMKNRAAIRKQVYNKAQDFIKDYEIVKDEFKNKRAYIQIKADIISRAVKKRLIKLHVFQSKINYKRLMLIYNPQHPKASRSQDITALSALNATFPEFEQFIFMVVNRKPEYIRDISSGENAIIEKCLRRDYATVSSESVRKSCEDIKNKLGLDILVEFEIIPGKKEVFPESIFSYATTMIKMKAYDSSNWKRISNVESNQWQLTDAAEESLHWSNAISKAAEKSAREAAIETINNTLEYYKTTGEIRNNFLIIFKEISEDKKENIIKELANIEGYLSMLPSREFAQFKIQYLSTLDKKQLALKILLKFKNLGLRTKYRELPGNRLLFTNP